MTGVGLLGKSFLRLVDVDPGYDPHNVLTANTYVYGARYQKPEAGARAVQPGDGAAARDAGH